MFVYIILILGTWNGVLGGTDDICDTPSYRACSPPKETRHFPKDEKDVDQQCLYFAHYLDCLKEYSDTCGYENVHHPFSEERYQELKSLLGDMCRKDSQLHLNIVQNIGCLNVMVVSFPNECREYLQNKTAVLRQYMESKEAEENNDGSGYNPEFWTPLECVTESLTIACFGSSVSASCGSDAHDVVREVVARFGPVKHICAPIFGDRISELIRILELGREEERILHDIINKE